jgi:hypothetical protein
MFKALSRLFGKKKIDQTTDVRARIQSLEICDLKDSGEAIEIRIAKIMLFLVGKQILAMDLELEAVPAHEPYLTKNSRGYLLGIADGIIIHENKKLDRKFVDFIRESAFILVFGRQSGPPLARQTIAEFSPGSGLAQGYVVGTQEVETIFFGDGFGIAHGCGFEMFLSQAQAGATNVH